MINNEPVACQKQSELEWILEFARGRKLILEIGLGGGGTLYNIMQVAPPDAVIVSIDLLEDGIRTDGINKELLISWARENQFIYVIKGDSKSPDVVAKVKQLLGYRKFDFILIDGDHSYEGVKQDYQIYKAMCDGVILFHDIDGYNEGNCEVRWFWDELVGNKIAIHEKIGQCDCGVGVIINRTKTKFNLFEPQNGNILNEKL